MKNAGPCGIFPAHAPEPAGFVPDFGPLVGGTGAADAGYVQLVGWSDWAQDMTDAGVAALVATENHDITALLAAGDALVESCEGCHKEFKPDLPSERYMHPHHIGPSDEG